jgi:hypothetical protein
MTDAFKEYFPDSAGLITGAMSGPIGFTLAAAGVIYRHTTEHLAEQGKEFDELAELLAKPLGASIEDYNRHVEEGKKAVAKLQATLAHAGTDTDPIGTHFMMVRAFMDVFVEGMKNEVAAKGRNWEATLLSQNATSQQVVAARQKIHAIVESLDEIKNFFDGSGLLLLEQAVRQNAQPQLTAGSTAAVLAAQQVKNKNENRKTEALQLKNETGQGALAEQDQAFVSDQKQVADARDELERLKQVQQANVDKARESGASDDDVQEISHRYDQEIFEAEQTLKGVENYVEGKKNHLSQLENAQGPLDAQEADATVIAAQKSEEAAKNQHRLDVLPTDIVFAQFLEQIRRASNTKVAAYDAQTDKTLASLPPAVFGGTGSAGGRRVDPDRLNDILAGLILEQDALKKSLAESRKKQAQMERDIEELQRGQDLHAGQIRSANANRF